MGRTNDVPGSVRIRTGDGNEWRYDAIESASRYYGVNRSNAVAYACEDVTGAVAFVEDVLEREDLTVTQRREIVTLANKHFRGVNVNLTDEVRVETEE